MVHFKKEYQYYYSDRNFDRKKMIQTTAELFNIKKCLYPGCYIHIVPSFYIHECVYIDNDKKAKQMMLEKDIILDFIKNNAPANPNPVFRFYGRDYHATIEEPENSFDLIISQYAGFISLYYKNYLKPGGYLLANNSHGDASLISLDPDFKIIGYFNSDEKYKADNLKELFIPRKPEKYNKYFIIKSGRGTAFKKTAKSYLFKKINN